MACVVGWALPPLFTFDMVQIFLFGFSLIVCCWAKLCVKEEKVSFDTPFAAMMDRQTPYSSLLLLPPMQLVCAKKE